jgi:hypothetical protein
MEKDTDSLMFCATDPAMKPKDLQKSMSAISFEFVVTTQFWPPFVTCNSGSPFLSTFTWAKTTTNYPEFIILLS